MNKNTVQLVKEYVIRTLDEPNGITAEAYQALTSLMQEDREFALEMHDVVDRIATGKDRFFLLEESETSFDQAYEL